MRILVFGNSDTRGTVVIGPTWPERIRRELAEANPGEVELVDRNFVPLGRRAPEFAMKLAFDVAPDIVLLPLSEYTFWAVSVELQIRHRFGPRAANAFKSAELRLDRLARSERRVLRTSHRVARGFARRTIGTRAPATAEEVGRTYVEVLHRLARLENAEVVVVSYPTSPLPSMQSKEMRAARRRFLAVVSDAAAAHRMKYIDGDAVVSSGGLTPVTAYAPDGVHIGEAAHPLYAEAVLSILARGTPSAAT